MGQGEGNQYKYEKYDITGFIFQKQYGHFHPEQETFFLIYILEAGWIFLFAWVEI